MVKLRVGDADVVVLLVGEVDEVEVSESWQGKEQSGLEWEAMVVVVEVVRVEVLVVVCLHCLQVCPWQVWWDGGWGGEEVLRT